VTDLIQPRVRLAVAAALDKKATELDVLAVGELTSIADYFIIMSAGNERQAQAIADNIVSRLKEELDVRPLLVEGTTPGRWVLLDFGRPSLVRLACTVTRGMRAGGADADHERPALHGVSSLRVKDAAR
jgi:ribosome-associated protein